MKHDFKRLIWHPKCKLFCDEFTMIKKKYGNGQFAQSESGALNKIAGSISTGATVSCALCN